MAQQKLLLDADEELSQELAKLGYKNVPPDLFNKMKNELLELIEKESSFTGASSKSENKVRSLNFNGSVNSTPVVEKTFPDKNRKNEYSSDEILTETTISPRSFIEYKNRYKLYKLRQTSKSISQDSSESSCESISAEMKMKRKIMRKINGKSVITEELLDIPSAFNTTSYPETESEAYTSSSERSSKEFSGCPIQISPKQNNSKFQSAPGEKLIRDKICSDSSVVQRISRNASSYRENGISKNGKCSPRISNENLKSGHSHSIDATSYENVNNSSVYASSSITNTMNSDASSRSTNTRYSRSPPLNQKKKNDPVTMYNYYKKFWTEFKPPGEKTHDKLRWAVRDKMLDYSL